MPVWIEGEDVAASLRTHHVGKAFGPSETETAGAMTMKQQIDRLRAAQIVQGHWKRAHFPPQEALPDDFIPPEYGMDAMDAYEAARRVLRGQQLAKARQEAVDARKAKEAAEPPEAPAAPEGPE